MIKVSSYKKAIFIVLVVLALAFLVLNRLEFSPCFGTVWLPAEIDATKFKNKSAIITGASGGLGSAIVERAGLLKMNLVLTDIDVERSRQLADKINSLGGKAYVIEADLSKEEDRKRIERFLLPSREGQFSCPCGKISRIKLRGNSRKPSRNVVTL